MTIQRKKPDIMLLTNRAVIRPTVAIATRRASDDLREAIESVAHQQEGFAEPIETLLVAPGPEHAAIELIAAPHRGRLALRLVDPGAAGLSRARNAAARAATGDFIAFLDDDAVAMKGWLRALAACFKDESDAGTAGGPIRLLWGTEPRPAWWRDGLDEAFNALDFGPLRRRLRYPQVLYGTNIAFRRAALLDAGLFREDLGRAPGSLLGGEEAEAQLRLERCGHRTVFDPKAVVLHRVARERLRPSYIRSRAFHHGRSHSLFERELFAAGRRGRLRRALRASGLLLALPFSPRRHLVLEKDLLFEVGYLFEEAIGAFQRGAPGAGRGLGEGGVARP